MKKSVFMEYDGNKKDHFLMKHEISNKVWVSRRHNHMSVEIGIVLKGKNGFCVNDKMTYLSKNEISFINSLEVHYFDIVQKGCETITIVIGKDYLQDFCNEYGNGIGFPCFPNVLNNVEVNKKIIDIVQKWEKDEHKDNKLIRQGYINLIFGELALNYDIEIKNNGVVKVEIMQDILNYIDNNFRNKITLEEVAQQVGYAPNYCSALFHEYVKQDFRNYVNSVRIEECQRLMNINPHMRMIDIAYECGFSSVNSFYRAYKRVYNRVPKARVV